MYWIDPTTHKIRRANLNGTGIEEIISINTNISGPHALALDLIHRKVYWIDGGQGKISRANLDGSDIEELITSGLVAGYGIALQVR
jgi:low density lipoprotein receptor-related protein 5/6